MSVDSRSTRVNAMFSFLFLFALVCGSAFTVEPETDNNGKQRKRGILNDGWVGIPSPYGYGHGQPWDNDRNPWKALKISSGLHHNHGGWSYGGGEKLHFHKHDLGLQIHPEIPFVKTLPIYITKHVIVEKPVPVPQPVYIEKPYHVPVEKIVPVPVETIIHKTVPVPVPVPQAVPYPVEHPVPFPVKHPVPVPVQQPYPVPVKHAVPYPVPVPYPIAAYPGPIPHHGGNFYGSHHHGIGGHYYGAGHFHPHSLPAFGNGYGHGYPHGHGFGHGHGYGHGYGFGHGYGHDYHGHGYGHSHHDHDDHYSGHGIDVRSKAKRSKSTKDKDN